MKFDPLNQLHFRIMVSLASFLHEVILRVESCSHPFSYMSGPSFSPGVSRAFDPEPKDFLSCLAYLEIFVWFATFKSWAPDTIWTSLKTPAPLSPGLKKTRKFMISLIIWLRIVAIASHKKKKKDVNEKTILEHRWWNKILRQISWVNKFLYNKFIFPW